LLLFLDCFVPRNDVYVYRHCERAKQSGKIEYPIVPKLVIGRRHNEEIQKGIITVHYI